MSLKDSFWFRRSKLLCQFAPQFLCNGTHDLALEPLTHAALISPLPPTLEIMTRLKFDCPLRVKRTPPLLVHDTLQFMHFQNNILNILYIKKKKIYMEFVCVLYDFITSYRAQELCLHCLAVQCERKQAWTCQNAGEEDRTTLHYYLEGRNWWQLP